MAHNVAVEAALKGQATWAWDERWRFVWDMNGDGVYTISDTLLVAKWLFFAPGDWFLLMVIRHAPDMGVYFEITPKDLYGFGSGAISILCWMFVVGTVSQFADYRRRKRT
jgi:hypothetical protein